MIQVEGESALEHIVRPFGLSAYLFEGPEFSHRILGDLEAALGCFLKIFQLLLRNVWLEAPDVRHLRLNSHVFAVVHGELFLRGIDTPDR